MIVPLLPTPRGSKPTMSKRSRISLGNPSAAALANETPDAPGPPGLISSDPIRWLGSAAGMRTSEMPSVRASGWNSSSGTVNVAHSTFPQFRQASAGTAGRTAAGAAVPARAALAAVAGWAAPTPRIVAKSATQTTIAPRARRGPANRPDSGGTAITGERRGAAPGPDRGPSPFFAR